MRFRALMVTVIAAAAVLATAAIALVTTGIAGAAAPAEQTASEGLRPSSDRATVATEARSTAATARDFLAHWVMDGRVVRGDQGGDTVSEGQAYGLLVAAAAGDRDTFDAIWRWTRTNLMRPDGLLAWRWDNGRIVDAEPASDGDLDAARALVVAGARFGSTQYTEAGVKLGTAVLDRMSVETAVGRILLPGVWASAAEPYAYNPSYASPVAFALLGQASGDPRWTELSAGSAAVTSALLRATALPPDWAQVHSDGTVEPMPGAAGKGASVRYGYDAQRLPLRYAESCSRSDVDLAGRLAPTLSRSGDLPAESDLGGGPLTADRHPLALEARAAALSALGEKSAANTDLRAADRLAQSQPTYYGAAWAALGPLLLRSRVLGGCAPMTADAAS